MLKQENKPRGKKGEEEACRYLQSKGYRILTRNWTCRYGEIDIIALEKDILVFIEVKTRYSDTYGDPVESVTSWKIKSLIKSAEYFVLKHENKVPEAYRIDFVGIEYDKGGVKRINLIKSITE
jgi:putative endonuclease